MPPLHRVLDEAPPPPPAPLLWRDEMPPEVLDAHDRADPSPPVDLIEVRGKLLGGLGLFADGNGIWHEPGFAPRYIGRTLRRDGPQAAHTRRWVGGLLAPGVEVVRVDRPVLAPVSANWVYGHFLLDILPRAAILDQVCPPDWPVAVAGAGGGWLPRALALAVPRREIVTYRSEDQALAAPAFLGCSDPCTVTFARPELRTVANLLKGRLLTAAAFEGRAVPAGGGERIYLSRAGAPSPIHAVSNEPEIEAALAGRGFRIVRPEALPFEEQVRLFDGARLVVGEYGSGIHNTIFSRPGATVVCLNWLNGYQSRIAALFGQRVGYVAPEGGAFLSAVSILRSGVTTMRFDVPALLARLDALDAGGA